VASSARRRLSGILVATWFAIAAASASARASDGTFALLGGAPKIVSQLSATYSAGHAVALKIRQFLGDGTTPILKYEVEMQKVMHLVVVRDDFATFEHVHPSFDPATGTFSQTLTLQPKHRYYVYADTTPRGIGQQVFRFALGAPFFVSHSSSGPSSKSVAAGPYTVTLTRTTLPADRTQRLDIAVLKGGRPAPDLTTYLGAAAHAVFINALTLQYVHVHPTVSGAAMAMRANQTMDMAGGSGPHMQMSVPALPAGVYKLWIEFGGAGGAVYTAPFTMLVR
jgi:hypothetical protein